MALNRSGNTAEKIKSINKLAVIIQSCHDSGLKVVHCHGVFDLLHFEAAKREGDVLAVTVTADEFVNRGPGRPVYGEYQRARFIASLECVDFAAINYEDSAENLILKLKPDVYVKGQDYANAEKDITGKISAEKEAVESVGGRIHFTDEPAMSSSRLINTHFNVYSQEFRELVLELKRVFNETELAVFLLELKKRGAPRSLIKTITTILK